MGTYTMSKSKQQAASQLILKPLSVLAMAAAIAYAPLSNAGATFKIDDTKWVSVGAGLRTSFTATDDAAGNANQKWSTDFTLDNIRLYLNAQIHEYIKLEFNTECGDCSNGGDVIVLDAIGKFEINDHFNFWVGRMLVPFDRAELNGPFYHSTYDFNKTPFEPADQGSFDSGKFGRDDGVTLWGAITPDKKMTYAVGIFDGATGGSNVDSNLLYAGRVGYNFLNVESNPGYYTSSTYYGGAGDIFTLSFAGQYQEDGAGSKANPADFYAFTVDLLSETVLSNDAVVTIEGEFKHFGLDGLVPTDGGDLDLFEGDAYTGTALYLIPQVVGIGKFQPYLRYTNNDPKNSSNRKEYAAGLNYIIDSHNARISLMYQYGDIATKGRDYTPGVQGDETSTLKLGFQLQI